MKRREEIEKAAMQVVGVSPDWDILECFQVGYKEGAKWADETMIEKACQWIKENFECYVGADVSPYYVYADEFVEDFRKAITGEG